jgi:leucine-zipper-like transcriptional regulator 1
MASNVLAKAALGLRQYKKPISHPYARSITDQLNEYYGISGFHCREHEVLAKALKQLSLEYKRADYETKKKIALDEIAEWENYIYSRRPHLTEDYKINDKTKARLQRMWSLMLHRNKDTIECERLLDFHTTFLEHYTFDVPIDKRSLVEMVHPHAGYLVLVPRDFSFANMMKFYEIQILASFERSLGEDLLSKQISAFNYYQAIQGKKPSGLDKIRTNELLSAFKFPTVESLDEFKAQFSWTLQEFENEFDTMTQDNYFVRFAVFRKIFLDYNL